MQYDFNQNNYLGHCIVHSAYAIINIKRIQSFKYTIIHPYWANYLEIVQ